jgi:hypothetical protein
MALCLQCLSSNSWRVSVSFENHVSHRWPDFWTRWSTVNTATSIWVWCTMISTVFVLKIVSELWGSCDPPHAHWFRGTGRVGVFLYPVHWTRRCPFVLGWSLVRLHGGPASSLVRVWDGCVWGLGFRSG